MKRVFLSACILLFITLNPNLVSADGTVDEIKDPTSVTVLLLDSEGDRLTAGSLSYFDGSWQTASPNNDGAFTFSTTASVVTYRMNYRHSSEVRRYVPVTEDPVVFQTVNVTVQLQNSEDELFGEGIVEYYTGDWFNIFFSSFFEGSHYFGTTDEGVASKELLPGKYVFKMNYAHASRHKVVDISRESTITFETVKVTARLNGINDEPINGGQAYYHPVDWFSYNPDEWYDFGSTSNGETSKELFPKVYAVKMEKKDFEQEKVQHVGFHPVIVFNSELSGSEPPELTITQPADSITTMQDSILVSGSVDKPSSTIVTVNEQSVIIETNGTFSTQVALTEGENIILISAENQSGEITEVMRYVTKDTTPPQIMVAAPADSSFTNQQQITITGSVSEALSVLTVNADTVTIDPDGSFAAVDSISEGPNSITIKATDKVGNNTTQNVTVIGDFEAPLFDFSGIALDSPSNPDGEITPMNDGDTLQVDQSEVYIVGSIINELTDVTVIVNQDTVATNEDTWGSDTYDDFEAFVNLNGGLNPFEIKVIDQAANVTVVEFFVIAPTNYEPKISVNSPIDNYVTDSSFVHLVGTVTDSSTSASLTINNQPVVLSSDSEFVYTFNHKVFLFPKDNFISINVLNADENEATETLKVIRNYNSALPPSPKEVAPELDSTVVTTMYEATEFLFKGDSVIQRGVEDGTIEPKRTGVVRGKVLNKFGNPLSGVLITVLDHPEYGYTLSRQDGMFDMAVNGGGDLTFRYEKDNYLSVQRQTDVPWQDYSVIDSVTMIQPDPNVTTIDFSDSTEVAQGSVESDAAGSRQATLMFEQGTQATMVMPDGSTRSLDSIDVRATEYTVGENGPTSMPAELPPASGYTYAVEFSADEALQAGATEITFDKPVVNYVENFVGFPVGTPVPTGYYNREKGQWVPSQNGRVIEIKDITNGLAEIDITGDGLADPVDSLAALGIDSDEREELASSYYPGESLWRVELTHFTPWDHNWPYGPPEDAEPPKLEQENLDLDENDKSEKDCGSIISVQNQTLGEAVNITGVPCQLYYYSKNTLGFKSNNILPVNLTDEDYPESLKRIQLQIRVAGTTFDSSFVPQLNQSYDFQWDRKDAYGRSVQGDVPANVKIGYVYDTQYYEPSGFIQSFGNAGGQPISANRAENEITIYQNWTGEFNQFIKKDFGGWHPGIHHQYDLTDGMLYQGNGINRKAENTADIVREVLDLTEFNGYSGTGYISDLALGNDGSIYFDDYYEGKTRILRRHPDGQIETLYQKKSCPQISVLETSVSPKIDCVSIKSIEKGADGSIYFATSSFSHSKVVKLNPNGRVEVLADKNSVIDYPQENFGTLQGLRDIAVASDGSIYLASPYIIHKIGTDGNLVHFAGTNERNYSGDGGPARQAEFMSIQSIETGPDGSLYVLSSYYREDSRVRKITSDGNIKTVAGGNEQVQELGNGGPAISAELKDPSDIAIGNDGSLYIAGTEVHQIRKVTPEGIIYRYAGIKGDETGGFNYNDGAARGTRLDNPYRIIVGPDQHIYFSERTTRRIRKIESQFNYESDDEIIISSQNGSQLYIFDAQGKHLRTEDALTGNTLFEFAYDSAGLLSKITDIDGLETIIERGPDGTPTAFVAPFGQRTELNMGPDGYLSSIENPEGETVKFSYTDGGLLTTMTDSKNNLTAYVYDSMGYLRRVDYPNGGSKEFNRVETEGGFRITMTTAEGTTTQYEVDEVTDGTQTFTNTDANGLETVKQYGSDGSVTTIAPDSTTTYTKQKPDPRFGMQAPLIDSMAVETPSGLVSTMSQSRTITQYTGDKLTGLTDSVITNGKVAVTEYNGNQNLSTTTSPEGRQSFSHTDSLGRVIRSSTPGLEPVNYTYDSSGFLIQTEQGGRTTEFTYNSDGYLETTTDLLGRTETTEYDSVGRVTNQILPNGEAIDYTYDENGNLLSITPPGQPAHTFEYTEVDLTDGYNPPTVPDSAGGIHYTYNLDKQLVSTVFSDSSSIEMVYDTTNGYSPRPTKIIYDQGATSFDYDSTTGKLASITSSDSVVTNYSYDGSLTTQITTSGSVNGVINFTYNNDFQVISQSINGANNVGFTYDDDELLVGAGALKMNYDPQNGLLKADSLGAVTSNYSHNGFGELTQKSAAYNGSDLYNRSFTRDPLGRIMNITETIGGQTDTYEYSYNDIGYLVQVIKNGAITDKYEYDANGNCTVHITPTDTVTATYDDQDRMLSYGQASYNYGPRGDLQRKIIGTDTTSYNYDNRGNLRSVTLSDGTFIEYLIDGQDRRVAKKVNGQVTKKWLYADGLMPIAELDNTGSVKKRYGPGYIVKNDTTFRVIKDHLGSVRMIVNSETGEVVQRIDYGTWGNITHLENQDEFTDIGFSGGLYDKHTGLIRFGARDYDPQTGRWTAKDPILFNGRQTNLYVYVNNNPVNFTDPNGKIVPLVLAGAAIGAAVSGGIYAATTDNFSWSGLAGAAAGGAIAGGVGVVASPIAGAVGLGTGALGTAAVNAGTGALAGLTTAAIAPCQDASLGYIGSSAVFGGIGGQLGSKLFSTTGMSAFGQKGFPRTLRGITPKFFGGNMGSNARNSIYRGTTTSSAVGAAGPAAVQEIFY